MESIGISWNQIILTVIAFLFSWETINNIRYRKENKKLKQNDVKTSDVEAQKAQIELGELFTQKAAEMFKKMQELQEQTLLATKKNGIDNESIIKQMDAVIIEQKRLFDEQVKIVEEQKRQADELKRLADEQGNIVMFVNGEYQDFLRKNGFKKKKQ